MVEVESSVYSTSAFSKVLDSVKLERTAYSFVAETFIKTIVYD